MGNGVWMVSLICFWFNAFRENTLRHTECAYYAESEGGLLGVRGLEE